MATYGYKLVKTMVLKCFEGTLISFKSRFKNKYLLQVESITIILSLVGAMLTRLENSAKGTIIDDAYAKEE
jgi:hypothetical protein